MKVFFFHLMPYADLDLSYTDKYDSAWTTLPNSYYDPKKGAKLYNRYLDELEYGEALGYDIGSDDIRRRAATDSSWEWHHPRALDDLRAEMLRQDRWREMTGGYEFNEVFFDDARIPAGNVVGARGQGWTVSNATLKHERGMMGDPNASAARMNSILQLMGEETLDGMRVIDMPVFRDRAMRLQGKVLAMQYHGMRLLTMQANRQDPGLARLIVKLQACEINHQLAALAVDVMGEMGLLYHDSPLSRSHGVWQKRYMFDLAMIIGGGTAQIQKNLIAERGLGLPREPKLAKAK